MKNRLLISTIICILLFEVSFVKANNAISKETHIYSIKGVDTLRMDRYVGATNVKQPCVIFAFGGGFFTGARDDKYYAPYYKFLVENGYTVIAIDYRLGLKDISNKKEMGPKDLMSAFENSIKIAVEDLYDATNFVLKNAEKWHIDKDMIITSGSSAGGVTVLQGEYERCNRTALAQRLPEEFKYAGVIAFAGAIYSKTGAPKWKSAPAPTQFFHGDADKNVPYNKIKILNYGLFGSKYIAAKYEEMGLPYYFYQEENANHILASNPMIINHGEIKSFLDKYVVGKQKLTTNTTVRSYDKPKVKKKFRIRDYIKTNFSGEPI